MTIQRVRHETIDPARRALYRNAAAIAVGGNLLLAAAKGVVAMTSGSSAVFADAANSLSDMLYSVLMAIGLQLAQQPADEGHPQGHSRFEPIIGLLIGVAMVGAGGAAGWESVSRFLANGQAIDLGWPTVVLIGGGVVKVGMFLFVRRLGRLADSPAIRASGWDNLMDVFTSAAALLGVWGVRLIHPLADPAVGLLVALWILRAAWEIIAENLGYLTGRGASSELVGRIVAAASAVEGVRAVHQVIADHVGPRLRVDMHVDVDGAMPLIEAHAIADRVQNRVEALHDVDLAFVHLEPAGHAED